MRKTSTLLLLGLSVLSSGGCVAVTKVRGLPCGSACARQAVAIDGKLYVVDVRTGRVSRIAENEVSGASAFTPCDDDDHTVVIDVDDDD